MQFLYQRCQRSKISISSTFLNVLSEAVSKVNQGFGRDFIENP